MRAGRGAPRAGGALPRRARGGLRLSGAAPPPPPPPQAVGPLRAAVAAGLRGAFRLGRGDASGLGLVEATPEGAARSFWAAAICLPAFLALRLLSWSAVGGPAGGVVRALAAELIGYAAAWAGFALASRMVAEAFGRRARWPHFLAAWNYANVVQYLVLLALGVPAALGMPGWLANGLGLAAVGYALWLEWFVGRTALQLGAGQAVAFVALDLVIGLFINGLVARLSGD